ncbi:MAG: 4-hydroxy-tetrahydrodipicolinate reductase [Dehalococcoidales bacterium]|nr:4-hydroxy-tetrahydrodipicolinate reductase [Dehalococcoidales bacterium]
MEPIKVAVQGASGKMGQEVVRAVYNDPGMRLCGAVEAQVSSTSLALPDGSGTVPFSSDLEHIITTCRPDVLVDFTIAKATMPAARIAARRHVNLVIGTTGFSPAELDEIKQLAAVNNIGAIMAPNFALGAVLMIHLAKIASKYFDYAEIIELHHHKKADAPSGTANATAKAMAAARGKPFSNAGGNSPSRGQQVEGISLHSVRLPGLMAHQEVLLGTSGQTLIVRHDTINRECYMPGVLIAIREVVQRKGLIYGLDTLLGL